MTAVLVVMSTDLSDFSFIASKTDFEYVMLAVGVSVLP